MRLDYSHLTRNFQPNSLTFAEISSKFFPESISACVLPRKSDKKNLTVLHEGKNKHKNLMNSPLKLKRKKDRCDTVFDYYNMITQLHKSVKKKKTIISKESIYKKLNKNQKTRENLDSFSNERRSSPKKEENYLTLKENSEDSRILMKKNTLDHLSEEYDSNKISIQSPTRIEKLKNSNSQSFQKIMDKKKNKLLLIEENDINSRDSGENSNSTLINEFQLRFA